MSTYCGTNIYTCPNCGMKAGACAQMSGNSFGSRFWIDTYCYQPMGFSRDIVAKCSGCGKYYLVSEMKPEYVVDTLEPIDDLYCCNGFKDLAAAIEQFEKEGAIGRVNLEYALRIRLLWASTPNREGIEDQPVDENIAIENRIKLCGLERTSNFLRAEIQRELGNFGAAVWFIERVENNDGWIGAVNFVKNAIAARRTDVFELHRGEEGETPMSYNLQTTKEENDAAFGPRG